MRGPTASPIVCTLLLTLCVASSARAELALFRVEQRWHNLPGPPVTTPGGAGMYQGYVHPYYLDTPAGNYLDPPATAIVEPGNPVGGAFTLPQSLITSTGVFPTTEFFWGPWVTPRLGTKVTTTALGSSGRTTGQRIRPGSSSRPRWETRIRPTPRPIESGSTAMTGMAIRSPRPPPSTVDTT
jgi:hypothetical protein